MREWGSGVGGVKGSPINEISAVMSFLDGL